MLFLYLRRGFPIAAVINLPFVPEFAVILAATVPALATYPYWVDLRTVRTWWQRPRIVPLVVGLLAAAVAFPIAAGAIGRQIGGTDAAAQANWWADYAEHVSLLAVAALIASSGRAGLADPGRPVGSRLVVPRGRCGVSPPGSHGQLEHPGRTPRHRCRSG